ncbi:MAG: superoxide dismutase [Phycisphaerales bacterium]
MSHEPCETPLDRRATLAALGGLGALSVLGLATGAAARHEGEHAPKPVNPNPYAALLGYDPDKAEFTLARLPYDHNALEPHIDAQTMEIHHSKHHQAYVNGLNKAVAELAKARDAADFALIKHWSRELAFHGGGHINHAIFWHTMAPPAKDPGQGSGGGGKPTRHLAKAIDRDFGSYEKFVAHFSAAANAVEGAGWAWLVLDRLSNRLMVQQMEKQQDMLLTGGVPLLGVDVWEHAYYLKYQNKRADYIKAWWNVVAWEKVAAMFEAV